MNRPMVSKTALMIFVPISDEIRKELRRRGWPPEITTEELYGVAVDLLGKGILVGRPYEGQPCIILEKTYRRYEKGPKDYYTELHRATYRDTIDAYETKNHVIHRDAVLMVIA